MNAALHTQAPEPSLQDMRHQRRFAVGRRLAAVRAGLELTQVEFAKMLGVSKPTYSAWENGQRDIPPMFAALQDRFGIDPQTALFEPAGEPPAVALDAERLKLADHMAGQDLAATGLRVPDDDFWDLVSLAYDLGPGADTGAALVEILRLPMPGPPLQADRDGDRFIFNSFKAEALGEGRVR